LNLNNFKMIEAIGLKTIAWGPMYSQHSESMLLAHYEGLDGFSSALITTYKLRNKYLVEISFLI
jgi:hypothetical protein